MFHYLTGKELAETHVSSNPDHGCKRFIYVVFLIALGVKGFYI